MFQRFFKRWGILGLISHWCLPNHPIPKPRSLTIHKFLFSRTENTRTQYSLEAFLPVASWPSILVGFNKTSCIERSDEDNMSCAPRCYSPGALNEDARYQSKTMTWLLTSVTGIIAGSFKHERRPLRRVLHSKIPFLRINQGAIVKMQIRSQATTIARTRWMIDFTFKHAASYWDQCLRLFIGDHDSCGGVIHALSACRTQPCLTIRWGRQVSR